MHGETAKDTQTSAGNDPLPAKGRRRVSRKTSKDPTPKKFKVTYYLTGSAIERVGVAATMEHLDKSEVVERLIHEHLRKWVVSCRGQRPGETDEGKADPGERSLAG